MFFFEDKRKNLFQLSMFLKVLEERKNFDFVTYLMVRDVSPIVVLLPTS